MRHEPFRKEMRKAETLLRASRCAEVRGRIDIPPLVAAVPLDPDDILRWELVYISPVVTIFTNQYDQCGLVGVVGYHVRLTRERSPVRTWHETFFFFRAHGSCSTRHDVSVLLAKFGVVPSTLEGAMTPKTLEMLLL